MNHLNAKNVTRLFLKLYPVQIFMVISSSLSSLINGLIIGNSFDASSMTALGFAVPVISIITSTASVISGGAGVLCGRMMGEGELKKLNNVFSTSVTLLFAFGLVSAAGCFIFSEPIARLCGADAAGIPDTILYLRCISVGIIPLVIIPCMMVFLQLNNEADLAGRRF